jgi:hypothetical protein
LKKLEHPDNLDQFRAGLQKNMAQIQKVQARSVEEKRQTIKTNFEKYKRKYTWVHGKRDKGMDLKYNLR